VSSARQERGAVATETAIWQDVEFGAYRADLSLWEELAREAGGNVLELGAGSGRVSLHLARAGHEMTALEHDALLAGELRKRAAAEELPLTVVIAGLEELAEIELTAPPTAAIAPLHVAQQIEPSARVALLEALASLLPSGAPVGLVLVDEGSLYEEGIGGAPTPDMREVDGWVYSSEPLWVQVADSEMTVRRLRERVSPDGEIERGFNDEHLHRLTPETLEAEAGAAGLAVRERRPISAGPREADSVTVILEAR
jgi:SAM-dependent methyltransferase